MKSIVKTFVFCLLLINGLGALYGGWELIRDPDGSSMGLSTAILDPSPFHDFLIPGIILIAANGFLSFVVLGALIGEHRHSGWLVMIQGGVLFGWIGVQCLMLQTVAALHLIFGGIGLVLIMSGWVLRGMNMESEEEGFKA